MPRPRSIAISLLGVALGVLTMATLAGQWLPPGLVAVAFAAFVILGLPRQPLLVAAFCAGAALAVAYAFALFTWAWDTSCADEVDGELVEYRCSDGPPSRVE